MIAVSVDAPVQSTYLAGDSDISIRCTLDVNVQLRSQQLMWLGSEELNTESYETGSGDGITPLLPLEHSILSLDLTFDIVSVSDAGEYTCRANIEDSMGESIQVMSNLTLFVESKLIINVLIVLSLKNNKKTKLHSMYMLILQCSTFLLHVQSVFLISNSLYMYLVISSVPVMFIVE